ncbi:MAG: DNA gyrase subunit A [Clostridia bacterium]|nr:DNA gyrase subunit A [Clostridia bacterium]
METQNNNNNTSRIIPLDLGGEMKKSFISYAMAVIINRALPDVRDGLKPVHRRIIYSMSEQGITPDKPHKKSARIVGDVLGKYHPHGDSAIYDSMVRMAQDFSTRYLLVDGHGNFGSVDGDGAAAMRYTEARMGKIAMELVRDIDKDTVDFYPNFDGTLQQPVTLPSRFPNLLVNGSGGIAVGMATNIPPHNLGEVVDATCACIDDPDITIDQLMQHLKGPDFPTGGEIIGYSGIRQAYHTGRGKIVLRAKSEIEVEKDHQKIVITEIPYQVNKEVLVGTIRELARDKKIDGIADANDESDHTGMRVVIDLKKGANASVVLNQLYKHTQLQISYGIIMLALVDSEPRVLNIKEVLTEYIKYQREVIERRTRFDLEKALKRAHILEGLLKALDVIDEIIHTIRASKDGTTARLALIEKFAFTEVQAQAILDMRLQRLTGLERNRLQEEYDTLSKQIAYFRRVLEEPALVYDIIKKDLQDIKARYSDERRTAIGHAEDEIDIEDLIQEEDMVITLTQQGYIKRTASDNYRVQRRGGKGITGLATKEEDAVKDIFTSSTHNNILFFTTKGKVYIKKCYQIPAYERSAKGMAIVNMLALDDGEKVSAVFPIQSMDEDSNLVMITKEGIIKKTELAAFANIRQNGIIAIALREEDELVSVLKTHGEDKIIIGSHEGMAIAFHEKDVRPMGRVAVGVRGMKLREGDYVIGAGVLRDDQHVLVISENGFGKRSTADEYREQARGGLGAKTMNLSKKTGNLAGIVTVGEDEDIVIINNSNVIIRMEARGISVFGRSAQGVRIMRLGQDEQVVSIAKLPQEQEEQLEETTEEA